MAQRNTVQIINIIDDSDSDSDSDVQSNSNAENEDPNPRQTETQDQMDNESESDSHSASDSDINSNRILGNHDPTPETELLWKAIREHDMANVIALIASPTMNLYADHEESFTLAGELGHLDILMLLVDHWRVNHPDMYVNWNHIYETACGEDQCEVVVWLLNARDESGFPLVEFGFMYLETLTDAIKNKFHELAQIIYAYRGLAIAENEGTVIDISHPERELVLADDIAFYNEMVSGAGALKVDVEAKTKIADAANTDVKTTEVGVGVDVGVNANTDIDIHIESNSEAPIKKQKHTEN